MLPSSKLLHEEPSAPPPESNATRDPGNIGINGASIPPENADRNDDDPPPYTAIAPPNHVGWPFNFPGIPYSAVSCRSGPPLPPFQSLPPTSGPAFDREGPDAQHTSISMPLMPCRLFKFGSHRSLFSPRTLPFSDNISVSKDSHRRTRKYGGILAAAAVIIFLMVLSLLVRFVMEKSLWRH